MPTTRRSRTVAAPPSELWTVIADPQHLPRWWPRVTRVEDVRDGAFTEVLVTKKGRWLRADFRVVASEEPHRQVWAQELDGSPFARILASAEIEVRLAPDAGAGTQVTLEQRQSLQGFFPRFGGLLVRRAARATLDEALDGLTAIFG